MELNSEIKKTDNKIILSGEFRVSLVDHDVELPTFMMRSIDKEIFVKYQLIFNKISMLNSIEFQINCFLNSIFFFLISGFF